MCVIMSSMGLAHSESWYYTDLTTYSLILYQKMLKIDIFREFCIGGTKGQILKKLVKFGHFSDPKVTNFDYSGVYCVPSW